MDILEIERRIMRACKTIRALPDRDKRFHVVESWWPEVVRSAEEAYGYTDAMMPKFRPTPFDVSDVLNALAWARGLEKREWRMVWWRSFDLSFRQIGRRIGRSDETARRQYRDVIIKLWGSANGHRQHLAKSA